MNLLRAALGRRLANDEQDSCNIGWIAAVPAMGLDGLGSASYGPEAALTVMIPVGAAGLQAIGWITVPIVTLLLLLYLSYRQTTVAYPSNVAPPPIGPATQALGAWILLRAFAAGCTAMTGVEAVSNGVSVFKPP